MATTVPPSSPVPTQTADEDPTPTHIEVYEDPTHTQTDDKSPVARPTIRVDIGYKREYLRPAPSAPSVDSYIESPGFRPDDDAFIARKRSAANEEEFRLQVAKARNQFIQECRYFIDTISTLTGKEQYRVVEEFLIFLRDSPIFPSFVSQHHSFRTVIQHKMRQFMADTSATTLIVRLSGAVLDRIATIVVC
jgi:hypothetical protein